MSKPIPKGVEYKGDAARLLDSRFLSSIHLPEPKELTIARVEMHKELIYENKTKDENVSLIHFEEKVNGKNLPLKLCKTNIVSLIEAHGNGISDWEGKKNVWYAKEGAGYQGKGKGVRVKS